jgi:hypothetical protein
MPTSTATKASELLSMQDLDFATEATPKQPTIAMIRMPQDPVPGPEQSVSPTADAFRKERSDRGDDELDLTELVLTDDSLQLKLEGFYNLTVLCLAKC